MCVFVCLGEEEGDVDVWVGGCVCVCLGCFYWSMYVVCVCVCVFYFACMFICILMYVFVRARMRRVY